MPNVELVPLKQLSAFRRIAIGTWQTSYDPTVYGSIDLRMEKALAYMEAFRERTGKRITVTHLVAKAAAEALRRCPEANAILRFNRIYLRKSVDISILVVQPDEGRSKVDLATCTIRNADQKTLYALALEIEEQVGKVRNRQDPAMEQGKKTLGMVPLFLINFMLKVIAFLTYALNLDMRRFGIPRDPFGSVTVTNIGSLGLDLGFVPLAPYTRVPLMVAVGAIKVQPVVEGEQVVPGKVMRLTSSFDHRLIDGFHASVLAKAMVDYLETPFEHLDKIEDLPATQETLATV